MYKEYLTKLGYSEEQIEKITSSLLIKDSLEETSMLSTQATWAVLTSLGLTKEEIIKITVDTPNLLCISAGKFLEKYNCLMELGHTEEETISILKRTPRTFTLGKDKLKERFNFYLKDILKKSY